MEKKVSFSDLDLFYELYEYESPLQVLIKSIFSLGLYFIWWFYKMNLKLEKVDEDAPDSRRGLVILLFFPPLVFLISYIFKKLIFVGNSKNLFILDVVLWSIVIFLSLKYIYDFCVCFGKWTASNGSFWYFFIYPGYYSIILYFFNFYYTLPLVFFSIIAIPGMQAFLNIKERRFRELKEHERFNRVAPAS